MTFITRPKCRISDRNRDRAAEVDHLHSADHAVGRQHRNRTNAAFAQVLLHFGDNVDRLFDVKAFARDTQRLIDRRQIIFEILRQRPAR